MTPQHLTALARANEVRLTFAGYRRAIKTATQPREVAAALVTQQPLHADRMEVGYLLHSLPRFGDKRTARFLLPLAISPKRRLGKLTDRQRGVLAASLTERSAA